MDKKRCKAKNVKKFKYKLDPKNACPPLPCCSKPLNPFSHLEYMCAKDRFLANVVNIKKRTLLHLFLENLNPNQTCKKCADVNETVEEMAKQIQDYQKRHFCVKGTQTDDAKTGLEASLKEMEKGIKEYSTRQNQFVCPIDDQVFMWHESYTDIL